MGALLDMDRGRPTTVHLLCTLDHICSVMGMSKDVVQWLLQLAYWLVPSSVFTFLVGNPGGKEKHHLCSLT